MRCPTLGDLPPPPTGKTGWPWTVESRQLPDTMPDGKPWPRISIVTPSYNQGQFIEETIRSVLLQGYPDLEYFVMDGGSCDETVGIIQKYGKWLTGWVSKKDGGQADAINKGFALSSGTIVHWINSDDFVAAEALRDIALLSDGGKLIVATPVINFSERSVGIQRLQNVSLDSWVERRCHWHQPGLWLNRAAWQYAGPLPIDLHYHFDIEQLLRVLNCRPGVKYSTKPTVHFRLHQNSKTVSQNSKFQFEMRIIYRRLVREAKFSAYHDFARQELLVGACFRLATRLCRRLSFHQAVARSVGLMIRAKDFRVTRFAAGALRRKLTGAN